MNKKNLFLMALSFVFVQYFSFAQDTEVRKFGEGGSVTATLKSYMNDKSLNGCMIENTSSDPVDVTYTIKFVKQFNRNGVTSDKEVVEKNGTVFLAPAGTPKVKGKPTARYWITAGDKLPVLFSETTVSIIVKKSGSSSNLTSSTIQKTDFPSLCETCKGKKGYYLIDDWYPCKRCGGTGIEPIR